MRPLEGITVLDLSQFLSAPSATLRLADLGARVIKVERPGTGDICRTLYISNCVIDGDSSLFHAINRNKQSVTLDLKDPASRPTLERLVREADVMVTNYRPGVAERLGVDYEAARKLNPAIVYGRHDQFGVDLAVDHSVHEAAEREAIGGVDPLVVIGEVLVHVDEPAVLEREALVVDHLHEVGVLANGTNRADEDRLGTGGVVLANRTDHVLGHLEKDRRRVTGELEANLGALPQLLRRDVIVVHASSCFRTTRPPRADGGIILLRGDRVSWLDCASHTVPVSYLMVS